MFAIIVDLADLENSKVKITGHKRSHSVKTLDNERAARSFRAQPQKENPSLETGHALCSRLEGTCRYHDINRY